MSKISYSKLNLKVNDEVATFEFGDQVVEVKQYLPINEKLMMFERILANSADENASYTNPIKLTVFIAIEIIDKYTNISLTDKQKEVPDKLYDQLYTSGLIDDVFRCIPEKEIRQIVEGVKQCSYSFFQYKNSALGVLETIKADYSNLSFDAEKIKQDLGDREGIELLAGIMERMG